MRARLVSRDVVYEEPEGPSKNRDDRRPWGSITNLEEMTVATLGMDALTWFRKQVEAADADLLREMITTFASTVMSAEADALCRAS